MKRPYLIAEYLRANPGASRKQIAKFLGCAPNTAGVHLQEARRFGLVKLFGGKSWVAA